MVGDSDHRNKGQVEGRVDNAGVVAMKCLRAAAIMHAPLHRHNNHRHNNRRRSLAARSPTLAWWLESGLNASLARHFSDPSHSSKEGSAAPLIAPNPPILLRVLAIPS